MKVFACFFLASMMVACAQPADEPVSEEVSSETIENADDLEPSDKPMGLCYECGANGQICCPAAVDEPEGD